MIELADGVHRIPLTPRDGINAYLIGDVLVDAGMPFSAKALRKALAGRTIREHVLTHAHPDHQGASQAMCDHFGLEGAGVGAADATAARDGRVPAPGAFAKLPPKLVGPFTKQSPVRVARELKEGDEVGPGFVVLETPGHSPGHVSFWREADGVLLCGDVFFGMNIFTTVPGVRQPLGAFTPDVAANQASERRLAALQPKVVGFGHGPEVRDPGALQRFVETL